MAEPNGAEEPLEGELLPLLRGDYEGEADLGGRPRLYETPEQFNDAVNAYYIACRENPNEPMTLTGLCLYMGFAGRDAMFRYAAYEGFRDAVTRARTLIEYSYEKQVLLFKNSAAARLLACIGGDDFWNVTHTVEIPGLPGTHEDRLAHLR
jgi:hypothetical protein